VFGLVIVDYTGQGEKINLPSPGRQKIFLRNGESQVFDSLNKPHLQILTIATCKYTFTLKSSIQSHGTYKACISVNIKAMETISSMCIRFSFGSKLVKVLHTTIKYTPCVTTMYYPHLRIEVYQINHANIYQQKTRVLLLQAYVIQFHI